MIAASKFIFNQTGGGTKHDVVDGVFGGECLSVYSHDCLKGCINLGKGPVECAFSVSYMSMKSIRNL